MTREEAILLSAYTGFYLHQIFRRFTNFVKILLVVRFGRMNLHVLLCKMKSKRNCTLKSWN